MPEFRLTNPGTEAPWEGVFRCEWCKAPYRERGMDLSPWWLEAMLRCQVQEYGHESSGICPECRARVESGMPDEHQAEVINQITGKPHR